VFATNLSRSFLSTGQLPHYRELEFSTECSSGHLASPSHCCFSQYTSQIARFDLTRGLVEWVQSILLPALFFQLPSAFALFLSAFLGTSSYFNTILASVDQQ
jgi:hypothetical protein